MTLRETVFRDPDSYFRHYAALTTDEAREVAARHLGVDQQRQPAREHPADPRARAPDSRQGGDPRRRAGAAAPAVTRAPAARAGRWRGHEGLSERPAARHRRSSCAARSSSPSCRSCARPAAARCLHRRPHARRDSSRPLGRQPDRHRSGAAQGVHVDDRARARACTASSAATPVVVYDEQSGVRAARAFWFLEYFGHPSVRAARRRIRRLDARRPAGDARCRARRRRASGRARARSARIATWRDVRDAHRPAATR